MNNVNNSVVRKINNTVGNYKAPNILNYFWGFGMLAGLSLVIQIGTGLFLAQHYIPTTTHAFNSIARILLHVPHGWLMHALHVNGATMFFAVIYIHIAKNIGQRAYVSNKPAWFSGLVLLLLLMATAFTGYVLPWGQMSFWGAVVITSFLTAIPHVGVDIATWLWGGYAVDGDTLNRFFVIHFFLPFVMCGVVVLHILFMHDNESNVPVQTNNSADRSPFAPFFLIEDAYIFWIYIWILLTLACLYPDTFRHPENFIKANPMRTPSHIVPEWYFLPFYAILRAVPDKLIGLLLMLFSIFMLFVMPFLEINVTQGGVSYTTTHYIFFVIWSCNFLVLLAMGAKPIEYPYIEIARIATVLHFYIPLVIFPFVSTLAAQIIQVTANTKKN